jgi:hypothetical protein
VRRQVVRRFGKNKMKYLVIFVMVGVLLKKGDGHGSQNYRIDADGKDAIAVKL